MIGSKCEALQPVVSERDNLTMILRFYYTVIQGT